MARQVYLRAVSAASVPIGHLGNTLIRMLTLFRLPQFLVLFGPLGHRGFLSHLRTFADYLVGHFSAAMSAQDSHLAKYGEVLNQMIWKYNIFSLDRLVLVLSLRYYENNEAQVHCRSDVFFCAG